jgi:hypothetical protein
LNCNIKFSSPSHLNLESRCGETYISIRSSGPTWRLFCFNPMRTGRTTSASTLDRLTHERGVTSRFSCSLWNVCGIATMEVAKASRLMASSTGKCILVTGGWELLRKVEKLALFTAARPLKHICKIWFNSNNAVR